MKELNPSLKASLVLMIATIVFLGSSYFFFVRKKTRYFTERNLRQLASIGRQVENTIASHERVLLSFASAGSEELLQEAIESGLLGDVEIRQKLEIGTKGAAESACREAQRRVEDGRLAAARAEKLESRFDVASLALARPRDLRGRLELVADVAAKEDKEKEEGAGPRPELTEIDAGLAAARHAIDELDARLRHLHAAKRLRELEGSAADAAAEPTGEPDTSEPYADELHRLEAWRLRVLWNVAMAELGRWRQAMESSTSESRQQRTETEREFHLAKGRRGDARTEIARRLARNGEFKKSWDETRLGDLADRELAVRDPEMAQIRTSLCEEWQKEELEWQTQDEEEEAEEQQQKKIGPRWEGLCGHPSQEVDPATLLQAAKLPLTLVLESRKLRLGRAEREFGEACRQEASESAVDDLNDVESELLQPLGAGLEEKWRELIPLFERITVNCRAPGSDGPPPPLPPGQAVSVLAGDELHIVATSPPTPADAPAWRREVQDVCALIRLDELLRPIFRQNTFEAVALARADGTVIYQSEQPELVLTRLDPLVKNNGGTSNGGGGAEETPDFAELARTTQMLDVDLAGDGYKLFLQPQALPSFRTTLDHDPQAQDSGEGWVVAGLVSARRFRYASLAVSTTLMIGLCGVLLLAVFSYPFLKVSLLGNHQRLRILDVLLLAISTLLGVGMLTIFVIDAVSYGTLKSRFADQLVELTAAVENHVQSEVRCAYAQLERLEPRALAVHEILERRPAPPGSGVASPGNCRVISRTCPNLLRDREMALHQNPEGQPYPYLHGLALLDEKGEELLKWSIDARVTPRVSVASREYFETALGGEGFTLARADALGSRCQPSGQDPFALESIISLSDGSRRAILAKPLSGTQEEPAGSGPAGPRVIALALPMLSLIDPVLPPGFGFAVIEADGRVLFHSDKLRNLSENFFTETGDDPALKAAVFARRTKQLELRYGSREWEAYVKPMASFPWFLVTFHDKEMLRITNIEAILVAALFLLAYTTLYVAAALGFLLVRPGYRVPWLWPRPDRIPTYLVLAGFLLLLGVLGGAAAFALFPAGALLALALVLPAGALAATLVALRGHGERLMGAAVRRLAETSWGQALFGWPLTRAYKLAAGSLLLVIVVLPVAAFFKVGYAIHGEALMKYGQLLLARSFEERWERLREAYDETVGEGKGGVLKPRASLDLYDVYAGVFFKTDLKRREPVESAAVEAAEREGRSSLELPKAQLCGHDDPAAGAGRRRLHRFLRATLPHYGRRSADLRELLDDRSSDRSGAGWRWDRETMSGGLLFFERCAYADGKVLRLETQMPLQEIGKSATLPVVLLLLGVFAFIIGWIVHFVAHRILLVDLVSPLWLDGKGLLSSPLPPGRFWLFGKRSEEMVHGKRSEEMVQEKRFLEIDLRQLAEGELSTALAERLRQHPHRSVLLRLPPLEKWLEKPSSAEPSAEPSAAEPSAAEPSAAEPSAEPSAAEPSAAEPSAAEPSAAEPSAGVPVLASRTLELMKDWEARFAGRPAAIVSDWDPAALKASWRDQEGECAELCEQFGEALQSVSVVPVDRIPRLAESRRKHPNVLDSECAGDPVLTGLGRSLKPLVMPRRKKGWSWHDRVLEDEQILEELGERAEPYYTEIWEQLSEQERLALLQVAEEGLANSKNRRAVRRLLALGLILQRPEPAVWNETFRRFVIEHRDEVAALEFEESAWDRLRWPLTVMLVGALIFLALTQQDFFDTTIALLGGVAAAIPVVFRLLGFMKPAQQILGGSAAPEE